MPSGEGRRIGGLARNLDLVVILVWLALVATVALIRKDFTGDGVRHLAGIVDGSGFRIVEPRWMFFPALLFLLLRPLVVLGLVTSVEGLTRPMVVLTLLLAALYMLALRACLRALGVRPVRRAASLALAGSLASLFLVASDLMEPIFGATLAMGGLAWAARHARDASADVRRRAVLVAVACIAAASLLYQGLLFGIGLIPALVPVETLKDRRTLLGAALIVAAVPAVVMLGLVASGNSVPHAFARFAKGEENPFYRSYLKKSGVSAYAVALLTGPPNGVVIGGPDFHGWRGVFSGLRDPALRAGALETLARTAAGMALLGAGIWAAVRRRDYTLLLGLCALLVLPVVRRQQAGYLKFYIFLPVLVALGAAHARPSLIFALAAIVLVANGARLPAGLIAQQPFYREHVQLYDAVGPRSCWLTTAWVPPFYFRWQGRICPILGTLTGGSGEDPQQLIASTHANMDRCLQDCFCQSASVLTDDMTEAALPNLAQTAQAFSYSTVDLTKLIVPEARAERLSTVGSPPVYRYPAADQRRLCAVVSAHR